MSPLTCTTRTRLPSKTQPINSSQLHSVAHHHRDRRDPFYPAKSDTDRIEIGRSITDLHIGNDDNSSGKCADNPAVTADDASKPKSSASCMHHGQSAERGHNLNSVRFQENKVETTTAAKNQRKTGNGKRDKENLNDIRDFLNGMVGTEVRNSSSAATGKKQGVSGKIWNDSFLDAYDRVPLERPVPVPERRFHPAPCRKKEDRKQLRGYECPCCRPYYDALDLSPNARKERINKVSRHRAPISPPKTPERHWEVTIPSTQECIEKGLICEAPYVPRLQREKLLTDRSTDSF